MRLKVWNWVTREAVRIEREVNPPSVDMQIATKTKEEQEIKDQAETRCDEHL